MNEQRPAICALGISGDHLSAWRDHLLNPREMTRIETHLPTCPACQQHLAQFDAIAQGLRAQRELEPGNRIWNHVQTHISQPTTVHWLNERNYSMNPRSLWGGIGATALVLLLAVFFFQVLQNRPSGPASSGPATTVPAALFKVTSIGLTVNPASVAGIACGSQLTVTYTATFHVAPSSPGGTIQFNYTSTNGRGSNRASVAMAPGQTSATYSYSATGTLSGDHTFPGIGEVISTSPNVMNSPQVSTQGVCSSSTFKVTSIDLVVNPASVAGLACGNQLTVTYTATFHIAAGGPGGTIQFNYTSTNGRGSARASVTVAAGQTSATYAYSTTGTLASDHTFAGIGEVITSSPNTVNSSQVAPQGTCK